MTGTWKTKGVSAKRLRYGRISSNLPLLFLALFLAFLLPCSLLLSLSSFLYDLSSHCLLHAHCLWISCNPPLLSSNCFLLVIRKDQTSVSDSQLLYVNKHFQKVLRYRHLSLYLMFKIHMYNFRKSLNLYHIVVPASTLDFIGIWYAHQF